MLKCLIIAAVFWFNPLISNVDFLPDFIGYLLVIKAFSKASYLYDYVEEACSSAKKMCLISVAKFFSIALVSSLDTTMSLLLSFCFALVECIFGIPFVLKLFNAYTHIIATENTQAQKLESGARIYTIVAFVSRLILAILPDLTALSLNSAFTINAEYTYLRFRPLFIGFSFIISLVISTVWLVKYVRFLRKAITEEVRSKCISEFVKNISDKKSIFAAKSNIRAIVAVIIGALFIFDFTWDYTYIDIFQDYVMCVLTAFALLLLALKKYYKPGKLFIGLLGMCVVHIVAIAVENSINVRYYSEYDVTSSLRVSEAETLYFSVCASALLSACALIGACAFVLLVMRSNARKNIKAYSALFSETDIDYYLQDFDRRTKKNFIITLSMSVAYGIEYFISTVFKPYAEGLVLLNMVFEIALIVSIISAMMYLYDEVYKRILLFS